MAGVGQEFKQGGKRGRGRWLIKSHGVGLVQIYEKTSYSFPTSTSNPPCNQSTLRWKSVVNPMGLTPQVGFTSWAHHLPCWFLASSTKSVDIITVGKFPDSFRFCFWTFAQISKEPPSLSRTPCN